MDRRALQGVSRKRITARALVRGHTSGTWARRHAGSHQRSSTTCLAFFPAKDAGAAGTSNWGRSRLVSEAVAKSARPGLTGARPAGT